MYIVFGIKNFYILLTSLFKVVFLLPVVHSYRKSAFTTLWWRKLIKNILKWRNPVCFHSLNFQKSFWNIRWFRKSYQLGPSRDHHLVFTIQSRIIIIIQPQHSAAVRWDFSRLHNYLFVRPTVKISNCWLLQQVP